MKALSVLRKGVTVILVGCVLLGKNVENYERTLCAEGTFRRYICTELFSAEAETINVLVS